MRMTIISVVTAAGFSIEIAIKMGPLIIQKRFVCKTK
jgi:hypothetical protein